jgi:hypothetical protein
MVIDHRSSNHDLGSWHDPDAGWLLVFPLILLVIHPLGSRLVASLVKVARPSVVSWLTLAAVVAGGLVSIFTASVPPAVIGVLLGPTLGVLLTNRSRNRSDT